MDEGGCPGLAEVEGAAVDGALDNMHMRCYIITEMLDSLAEAAACKVPAARTKAFADMERTYAGTQHPSAAVGSRLLTLRCCVQTAS